MKLSCLLNFRLPEAVGESKVFVSAKHLSLLLCNFLLLLQNLQQRIQPPFPIAAVVTYAFPVALARKSYQRHQPLLAPPLFEITASHMVFWTPQIARLPHHEHFKAPEMSWMHDTDPKIAEMMENFDSRVGKN